MLDGDTAEGDPRTGTSLQEGGLNVGGAIAATVAMTAATVAMTAATVAMTAAAAAANNK